MSQGFGWKCSVSLSFGSRAYHGIELTIGCENLHLREIVGFQVWVVISIGPQGGSCENIHIGFKNNDTNELNTTLLPKT
jgi:hypothetical protein